MLYPLMDFASIAFAGFSAVSAVLLFLAYALLIAGRLSQNAVGSGAQPFLHS